jgi:hypothetical protein
MGYYLYPATLVDSEDQPFAMSVWRMKVLRTLLDRLGVLDWERPKLLCDPREAFFLPDRNDPRRVSCDKLLEHGLAIVSDERGKVPAVKFFTDAGWLVRSSECRTITEALGRGEAAELLRSIVADLDPLLEEELRIFTLMSREPFRLLAAAEKNQDVWLPTIRDLPVGRTFEEWAEFVIKYAGFSSYCELTGGYLVH